MAFGLLVIIFFYSSSVFARFKGTYLYALTMVTDLLINSH